MYTILKIFAIHFSKKFSFSSNIHAPFFNIKFCKLPLSRSKAFLYYISLPAPNHFCIFEPRIIEMDTKVKPTMNAKDFFRKILRDKKVISAYIQEHGSLEGFDDPTIKLVKLL